MTSLLMMKKFPDLPEADANNEQLTVYYGEEEVPVEKKVLENVLQEIGREHAAEFASIELVFVDENEIVDINRKHLDRDYITDIISFRYDERDDLNAIEGTLYCCAPRIREQSREFDSPITQEFYRIFIHGLLHLTGFSDQTEEQQATMKQLENHYLKLFDL